MKKPLILILLTFLIAFSSFKNSESPIETIRKRDYERYNSFKSELSLLKSLCNKDIDKQNTINIVNQYQKVRKTFKKWEYLAEYYDPIFIKEYINGAPLPKLEQNSFGANILEPKGLQVIDELLGDPITKETYSLLDKEASLMLSKLNQLVLPNLHSSHVFIAARIQLVRLFTLGITGFDTPGTNQDNALTDAKTVIETLQEDLTLYSNEIKEKNSSLNDTITLNFQQALLVLEKQTNFETFDRFSFLKTGIEPLYKNLLKAHQLLEYEMPHEINPQITAYNYQSESLFDNDFLNANYYINVPPQFINSSSKHLGELLFFDPILSENNQRSCASCHNPDKGFTDHQDKSTAYNDQGKLNRNSPTLINCVYSDRYFHDLRAHNLTDQMEHVITNQSEFNTNWNDILDKINQSTEYKMLYSKAFHLDTSSAVNIQNTQFAMSVYVASLRSINSPFDQLVSTSNTYYNEKEQNIIEGFNLFMGKAACGTCHFAPVFNGSVPPLYTESESEILGVSENPNQKKQVLGSDKGRGGTILKEQVPFYVYSFKTPTVRNIEITQPYMHNGAYKTLDEVMTFYNNGGGAGVGIHLEYQTLGTDKLELSKKEIKQIIAFMNSLTDSVNLSSKPTNLPKINNSKLNTRKVGGDY